MHVHEIKKALRRVGASDIVTGDVLERAGLVLCEARARGVRTRAGATWAWMTPAGRIQRLDPALCWAVSLVYRCRDAQDARDLGHDAAGDRDIDRKSVV